MINPTETEFRDNYFTYWHHVEHEHFEVSTEALRVSPINPATRVIANLKVQVSSKNILYARKADTIFSGLESIGGFYESIRYIGLMLVIYFRDRLFHSSFLR